MVASRDLGSRWLNWQGWMQVVFWVLLVIAQLACHAGTMAQHVVLCSMYVRQSPTLARPILTKVSLHRGQWTTLVVYLLCFGQQALGWPPRFGYDTAQPHPNS